jgi:hypothetical protein
MRPVRVSTRWCARSCPQRPSRRAFVALPIATAVVMGAASGLAWPGCSTSWRSLVRAQ